MKNFKDWQNYNKDIVQLALSESIGKNDEIKACGCGVKLDLQEVVYPVLSEFQKIAGYGLRVDSAQIMGSLSKHKRIIKKIGANEDIQQIVFENSQSSVFSALVSLNPLFYSNPQLAKNNFRKASQHIADLIGQSIQQNKNIYFGKAHSIEAKGDFVLFDIFEKTTSQNIATHINNDTIITADSLIKTSSKISVFTALNNALNDLFVCGVTENIEIFPVFDETELDIDKIESELIAYNQYYNDLGVSLTIHPLKKVSMGISLIGATVIGTTFHKATQFSSLNPNDEIIVTRKLGDLSILALHRSLVLNNVQVSEHVRNLRHEVLKRLMTSQYAIGMILKRYLPAINEEFDPLRHISFATDISGPGLSVMEEAAEASSVDIQIENLDFMDRSLLKHYRRNHTSSTNGPMLIAGDKKVIAELAKELRNNGLNEVWKLGYVIKHSQHPKIWISPELKDLQNSENPRLDFYAPEVWFSNEKRRIPIFKNMNFGWG